MPHRNGFFGDLPSVPWSFTSSLMKGFHQTAKVTTKCHGGSTPDWRVTKSCVRVAQGEVTAGWHPPVWHNSMVTALYRVLTG